MSDGYCYPGSEVLINKLHISDPDRFALADRQLTMMRILDLLQKPVSGSFDAPHLCRIHFWIFQELYDWAGKYRTVEIAKGLYFCRTDYIEDMLQKIFTQLKSENYLKNCSRQELPVRLAYYLGEINAIHPFREGNGRTQREFIRELALSCGAQLNYRLTSRQEMLKASIESFQGDFTAMEILFRRIISFPD